MLAGLVPYDKNTKWVSSSSVRLLPDISMDVIMLGYKPLSGWGIQEDQTIQTYLDNTNSLELVEYQGVKYKCVKSKTYVGFWNVEFSNNEAKNLIDIYVIYDQDWPYQDSFTGVLGMAPNSDFYKYFGHLYNTQAKKTIFSLHYQ